MKQLSFFAILSCMVLLSCNNTRNDKTKNTNIPEFQEVKNGDYQLIKPKTGIKEILVLFGGYPEKAEDIRREFEIAEIAVSNNIAVVFMNFNQKLWLEENEKQALAGQLQRIFSENELPGIKPYFGGFSSGGNIALLLSDFLVRQGNEIKPKGVFVIDSPIDLVALYKSSEKNVQRNFSEPSVQESTWLIETLGKQFGNPNEDITGYETYAVYTSETKNFSNIASLKNVKIRLYSEPDTTWWKENRMADFDQMNAYYLEKLSKLLSNSGYSHVAYMPTVNKGYRANGSRHPHSWSIVDPSELIEWIRE